MRVLVTGSEGFLGWHTRLFLAARPAHEVATVDRPRWGSLPELVETADAVIHIAGVNRGSDEDVESGNREIAEDLAQAVRRRRPARQGAGPLRVVYANSTQDGNGSPYGNGKGQARAVLDSATGSVGGRFVDVRLPNLFGEGGRPNYNSFVATFVRAVIEGRLPDIADRPVALLHAQRAAQVLVAALAQDGLRIDPEGSPVRVKEVYELLTEFDSCYRSGSFPGEFPDLGSSLRVDLFNTYRAALFPDHYPIPLAPHVDARGHFVETVRSRGGGGQASFSTTLPGVTRGNHYHLRKIERFAVISGTARISLRRMFSNSVIDFFVSGDEPAAVDMPVGWTHEITNVGSDPLLTQFWSHELFDPANPDTYSQSVRPEEPR